MMRAYNAPFTKDEIKLLINGYQRSSSDSICIFFGSATKINAKVYFLSKFTKMNGEETNMLTSFILVNENNSIRYIIEQDMLDYSIAINELTNRLDTNIVKSTDIIINNVNNLIGQHDIAVFADVVLVDIRTIFHIFKDRALIILSGNHIQNAEMRAVVMAREWTQGILDNIVDYYGEKLPILMMYLASMQLIETYYLVGSSVLSFDFDDDPIDIYLHRNVRHITTKYLDEVQTKCTDLYNNLSKVIAEFS